MRVQPGITAFTALAAAAIFVAGGVAALAHATLVRAVPAGGATVNTPPSEVTLRFNEKLEGRFSSVVVRDANGKQVDKGGGTVDRADRTVMRALLQPLDPGVYKVEWRAVSADTHRVSGDFTFTVGE